MHSQHTPAQTGPGAAIGTEIDATSTVANSLAFDTTLPTPGTTVPMFNLTETTRTTFNDRDNNTADFLTPSGQNYQAMVSIGKNAPGLSGKCFANGVFIAS
ncbi:MAG: hypothetical protein QOJ25_1054 [Solirubrobacteraceae bacterium]|jgi:hypothetical protein|nr:hypothetical protein [Solirubrobacteraceae bacterium]